MINDELANLFEDNNVFYSSNDEPDKMKQQLDVFRNKIIEDQELSRKQRQEEKENRLKFHHDDCRVELL